MRRPQPHASAGAGESAGIRRVVPLGTAPNQELHLTPLMPSSA
jgi:hypothetical protein